MLHLSLSSLFSPSQNAYRKLNQCVAPELDDFSRREKAVRVASNYLGGRDPCKTARRAQKLLTLVSATQPPTPATRTAGSCVHFAIDRKVPGYAMALCFWQRLDYASALAEAVSAGFRRRFTETPIARDKPMQILIREGGKDELSGLKGHYENAWRDHLIDEKSAVRLAERASESLLQYLISDAARSRIDMESTVEHLNARLTYASRDILQTEQLTPGDDGFWEKVQHAITVGLPHPTEMTLQRLCAPIFAEGANLESSLTRKKQIIQALRHVDLDAIIAFMSTPMGRQYASLLREIQPLVAQEMEQMMPALAKRVRLAQWSLGTAQTP